MALEADASVSKINRVNDSNGNPQPPATAAFEHVGETNADPSSTISEELSVPDRASSISVLMQGADDTFSVVIEFSNTSVSYSGDSSTDVDEVRTVNAPSVTVTISGAATTCDYDIYIR